MPRGRLTFKQRDVTAAVKAVADAGFHVARVEVDREGKIAVYTGPPQAGAAAEPEVNGWDKLLIAGADM